MRKVFIDVGAYDGDTIRQFMSGAMLPLSESRAEFEVFGFEPMLHTEAWQRVVDDYPHNSVVFVPKAAWIYDGELTFTEADYHPMSNTVMPECHHYDRGNQRPAQCLDLATWIADNFSPDDFIVMKMDIEGAEYDVLDHMIERGVISYLNALFVEFHEFIMPEEYVERHRKIAARCPIPIGGWG